MGYTYTHDPTKLEKRPLMVNYVRPYTLESAVTALENAAAVPLVGGGLTLNRADIPYEVLVDLQDVPELNRIDGLPGGVTVGAGVTLQDVVEYPGIAAPFKAAISRTLPRMSRNNTAVMETLIYSNAPLDWLTLLAAYDVTINMMGFDLELQQFALTETDLVAGSAGHRLTDGLILSVFFPNMHADEAISTAHVAPTPAAPPIVSAAAIVRTEADSDNVLVAFAAVGGASQATTLELLSLGDLSGGPLTAERIAAQAAQVPHVLNPPDDASGSADYRKAMAQVLVGRALEDIANQFTTMQT